MLRRNPLAALAMHKAGLPRQSLQEEVESHHAEQVRVHSASQHSTAQQLPCGTWHPLQCGAWFVGC